MSVFKKIFRNAAVLASGSIGASAIGLVSFALIARTLSPEIYGILVLAQAYAIIVDRLINFQSWQALIKYGTDLEQKGDNTSMVRLLQFGFILDLSTAILACAVGLVLPQFIGGWMDWSAEKIEIASIFCIVIIFNIEGTPTAILRIFDKFKSFAFKDFITALLKVSLVIVGYFLEFGLWYFVVVSMLSQVVGYIYLLMSSLRLLKEKQIRIFDNFRSYRLTSTAVAFPGIWSFVWTTNLHGTVRMTTLRLDTIIIDSLLGSAATGLYQVSKQFTRVFTQVSQPLYKSIYPELTKLWAQKDVRSFQSTIIKFMLLGLLFGLVAWVVFFFAGEFIIVKTVGAQYIESFEVTLWYMSAIALSVMAFPLTPALLAMGRARVSFYVLLAATVVYFAVIFPLLVTHGIVGAGIAYLIFYIVWLVVMIVLFRYGVAKRGSSE